MRQARWILLVAVVLAVAFVFLRRDDAPSTSPSPTPGLVAVAGEIRTIPALDPDTKSNVIAGLGHALSDLYSRAFLETYVVEPDTPEPTPATHVDDVFTDRARAALRADPDVFRIVEDLDVRSGRVSFGGVVTLEKSQPVHAALEVEFLAEAVPLGRRTQVVRLRQIGSLLLVARTEGWRVAAFDLTFSTRPQPSPTPNGS